MEWLDNLRAGVRSADEKATNALRYYLGPAYAPVNALAQGAALLSPGEDFMDMYQQGNALMQSRTPTDAGMNALGMGAATMGMFLGPAAKIANHGALELAQKLDLDGADARRIWDETGWFKGADDQWRFEIDDSAARLTPWEKDLHGQSNVAWPGRDGMPTAMPAAKWMDHPELDKAYWPTQSTMPGVFYDDLPGLNGQYRAGNPGEDFIDMSNRTVLADDGGRSTGLHELQHAVQQREGFAKGANVAAETRAVTTPEIEQIERRLSTMGPLADDFIPLKKRLAKLRADAGMAEYRKAAGEVESRNVQTRRDWPMDQRRATPPWETEDVPRDQQIVRFK